MLVTDEGKLVEVLVVADTLNEDSVQAIREFEKIGIKNTMLTGNKRRIAETIA